VWLSGVNREIHRLIALLLGLATLALSGCSKAKSPEVAATPPPTTSPRPAASSSPSAAADRFACDLLTKEEIQSVQGEAFASTMPSQGAGPGLVVNQCYFQLPTPVNSVVLTVTRKGTGAAAQNPTESWRQIFYPDEALEKKQKEREEEGERKRPDKVEGVGDEAFWTGSRVGGALYVLKGNCYIRLSVGGAGDQAQKIEKCKALAAAVLKRLP
jgi:hypothetical protein